MRKMAFLALFSICSPAAADGVDLSLAGYVSSWTQAPGGIPVPAQVNVPVRLNLGRPSGPGEARAVFVEKELASSAGPLELRADFFSVCPHGDESCSGTYFQAKAVLSGPVEALCAAYFNEADFAPFPVMACAGRLPDGRFLGVTLHRVPFKDGRLHEF